VTVWAGAAAAAGAAEGDGAALVAEEDDEVALEEEATRAARTGVEVLAGTTASFFLDLLLPAPIELYKLLALYDLSCNDKRNPVQELTVIQGCSQDWGQKGRDGARRDVPFLSSLSGQAETLHLPANRFNRCMIRKAWTSYGS